MKFFFGVIIGLVLAILIAAGAAHYAFGDLNGFGERDRSNDLTETFDFMGFDQIDVGGVFELEVTVGEDFGIEVSGAAEDMARLEASVDDGVLTLRQSRRERGSRRWRNRGLDAVITLPALNALNVSGVGEVDVTGIDALGFEAAISGVGDVELVGSCENLVAEVSGIGDFDAKGLECQTVDIDVSGIGDADVYASQSVTANVSGIGSVSIYGSPARVDKSGSFLKNISVK